MAFSRALRLATASTFTVAACGESGPRPRPVEIPIAEYRVDDGPVRSPTSRESKTPALTPAPAPASAERDSGTVVAVVPNEEPRGSSESGAPLSKELDVKGGFLGATLGSGVKAHRGLVLVDKKPEQSIYRVPDKSYGGIALRDVLYTFRKGKLATIQFAVKNAPDCRPVRETLLKELGAPFRSVGDTVVWRGEKVGMRFVIGSTGACTGTVLSRDLARAAEWDSL